MSEIEGVNNERIKVRLVEEKEMTILSEENNFPYSKHDFALTTMKSNGISLLRGFNTINVENNDCTRRCETDKYDFKITFLNKKVTDELIVT